MRLALATLLIVTTSGLIGCVSQTEADNTSTAYRKQLELNEELRRQIDELNARIRLLEGDLQTAQLSDSEQIATLREERDLLIKQRDQLIAENKSLQSQIDSLRERIANMPREKEVIEKEVIRYRAVTPELDTALKNFVKKYPDIATYDSAKGMIKLRSDVTFALGSDNVQPNAARSLAQLAKILNAPAAAEYEVRVVGHTDDVKISKPATKRRHPDNWYLSVHRAVAVREVMEAAGIPPTRLSVAGYGPYRPVVENTRRGAEANRRVEIYLVPMTPLDQRLEASIDDQGDPDAGGAPERDDDVTPIPLK